MASAASSLQTEGVFDLFNINQYEVNLSTVEKLGQGGFASVVKSTYKGQTVAIKRPLVRGTGPIQPAFLEPFM
jgi:hypothetical protein